MVSSGTGLSGTVLFSSSSSHVVNTYKILKREHFQQFVYECGLKYLSNAPCLQHICVLSVSIIAMAIAVLTSKRTSVMHWKSQFNTVKVAVNLSVSLLQWVLSCLKESFLQSSRKLRASSEMNQVMNTLHFAHTVRVKLRTEELGTTRCFALL